MPDWAGFWRSILDFQSKFFPMWRQLNPIYWSNALAGEVGELCNAAKHLYGGGTSNTVPTLDNVLEEIGDSMIYLLLFAESLGIHEDRFIEALWAALRKNRERMEARK